MIYNAFEHLRKIVFLFNVRERLMVMLTGHFDESYNSFIPIRPDMPLVYTIAGYLAEVDQWTEFRIKWNEVLNAHSLPPFSMKEFTQRRGGPFRGWKWQRKDDLLRELHQIISDTYIKSFSTSIVTADYYNLPVAAQYAFGKRHQCAAVNCFKHIKEWAEREGFIEPIQFVFELGANDEKSLSRWTENLGAAEKAGYKIDCVSFQPKSLEPLQAADILAYETRRACMRILPPTTNPEPCRPEILRLHDPARDEWYFMGKAHFEKTMQHPTFVEALNDKEFEAKAIEAKALNII